MMRRVTLFSMLFVALVATDSAYSQMPGIWFGDGKKDPVTDKNNVLAFIYDDEAQGSVGLRCRSGKPALLIVSEAPQFSVGERRKVTIRFDSRDAREFTAVATEPRILVVDADPNDTMVPALEAKKFVIRFSGLYGRTITMPFTPALKTNQLALVGRVLAECRLAEFPSAEIKKATDDLSKESEHSQVRKHNR